MGREPGEADMLIGFEDRASDSPFIERVWRSHSERAGSFQSIAYVHWEMVVSRLEGRTTLTVRGPETRPTSADCPAEGEWVAIRFKLGTFMPRLRPGQMLDRRDVTLPAASRRSFWLSGSSWEYPGFESAESFVNRLVRAGLIAVDPAVATALREPQALHPRTAQRHVLQTTGLTLGAIRQIERARHATMLLEQGLPIVSVVGAAGYHDQAHLTRSLKRFIGRTPAQVRRAEQQLSFLYKTRSDEPATVRSFQLSGR
jgi:AraC-like DNA-binding protein